MLKEKHHPMELPSWNNSGCPQEEPESTIPYLQTWSPNEAVCFDFRTVAYETNTSLAGNQLVLIIMIKTLHHKTKLMRAWLVLLPNLDLTIFYWNKLYYYGYSMQDLPLRDLLVLSTKYLLSCLFFYIIRPVEIRLHKSLPFMSCLMFRTWRHKMWNERTKLEIDFHFKNKSYHKN